MTADARERAANQIGRVTHCQWCGVDIRHLRPYAKTCSRGCLGRVQYRGNKDKAAAYHREKYRLNRAAMLEKQRRYQAAHKAEQRARAQQWYLVNRDRHKQIGEVWRLRNPDRDALTRRRVEAARRANIGSDRISERDWLRLVRRYRHQCAYCDVPVQRPHMDHVVPLARGGRHTIGNVLPVCGPCNYSKNRKLLAEWRLWQRHRGAIPM